MKFLASLLLAIWIASPLACFAQADLEKDPAFLPIDKVLDLKAIPPQVNVNLPRFLLKDAISALNSTNFGNLGTDLGDVVKEVKLIRVLVFESEKNQKAALDKGMKALQEILDAKWTSIVSVPEENVRVYAIGDAAGESVAGIALLIQDGEDAVVANVVGHVSLGKLLKIATESKKLPKDLLKKLSGVIEMTNPAEDSKNDKKTSDVTTNAPSAPPAEAAKDSTAK